MGQERSESAIAWPGVFAIVAIMLMGSARAFAQNAAPPELPPRAEILSLAEKAADWQLEDLAAAQADETRAYHPRGWEQGAFWVGFTRLAEMTGEARYLDAVMRQGEANRWQLGSMPYFADDHVIGQTYLWAAENGAGAEVLEPLQEEFDRILAHPPKVHLSFVIPGEAYLETPCLKRWCWCDALFMGPPTWLGLSRVTSNPAYAEFALEEFRAATAFLYDEEEQLYFRDSRFFERRDDEGRKLFWARGNGWVLAGLANMLREMPEDDPARAEIETLFTQMARRLIALQKPDGYRPPSLLAPEGSPPESSGTGFFVYGLAWGVNHGLLTEEEAGPAIRMGWIALERAVAEDGRVGWVQPVSDRPDTVSASDTHFYGTGAFLLAATEVAALAR